MNISKSGQNEQKPKSQLKPLQRVVLGFMQTINRPTAKKVADNFGISLRTAKRTIAFLKANDYLARRGNNRSGEYIIQNLEDKQYE